MDSGSSAAALRVDHGVKRFGVTAVTDVVTGQATHLRKHDGLRQIDLLTVRALVFVFLEWGFGCCHVGLLGW